ncbi:MAG: hypothetical protein ABTQ25_09280 [Nitrosomonas ureae]
METVIVSSIAFGYAIKTGYWAHVLVGTVVAPLLLMRTDYANQLGIRWLVGLERFFTGLYWDGPMPPSSLTIRRPVHYKLRKGIPGYIQAFILGFALPFLVPIFVIIGIPLIRTVAFLTGVVMRPLDAIRNIPVNWMKTVAMTDTYYVPEVIPGYEKEAKQLGFLSRTLFSESESPIREFYRLMLVLIAMPYRISVKATFPFYIPFIYLESQAFDDRLSFTQRLHKIKDDPVEKFARYYSCIVLFFFYLIPASVLLGLENGLGIVRDFLARYLQAQADLISIFTFVYRVETWHLTRLITIGLTLGLYIWVIRKLKEKELGLPIDSYRSGTALSAILYIRGTASLYTIACSLFLVWTNVKWPTIEWGGRIFPWQSP